jgi:hypothetical protein
MGQTEGLLFVVGGRAERKNARKKVGATASVARRRNNFTLARARSGPEFKFTSEGRRVKAPQFERDNQKIIQGV